MNNNDTSGEVGRKPKSKHGSGLTISVEFFKDDPQEMEALGVSRKLARIGNRKQYIVAVLASMAYVEHKCGQLPSVIDVANAIRHLSEE